MCLCVIIYRIYTWLSITTSDRVPTSDGTLTQREKERWCQCACENIFSIYTYVHVCDVIFSFNQEFRDIDTDDTSLCLMLVLPSLSNLFIVVVEVKPKSEPT